MVHLQGTFSCQEGPWGTTSLFALCFARIDESTQADPGDCSIVAGFTKPGSSMSAEKGSHSEMHACDKCLCGIYANDLIALLPTAKVPFFFWTDALTNAMIKMQRCKVWQWKEKKMTACNFKSMQWEKYRVKMEREQCIYL